MYVHGFKEKKIIAPTFALLKERYCDKGDISHKKMGHISVNFLPILKKLGTIMIRRERGLKKNSHISN